MDAPRVSVDGGGGRRDHAGGAVRGDVRRDPCDAAPPIFVETASPAPGPRGSIAVIGDSVMLGSVWETGGYGPSLGAMLAGDGWGPVVSKAGVGVQTGRFLPPSSGANMATWITNRRRLGWDAGTFVINLGANEVSSCFRSVECAVLSIDGFLDVIGPGHQVWWAKITMPDPADAATWNAALDIVAARRPELDRLGLAGGDLELRHPDLERRRASPDAIRLPHPLAPHRRRRGPAARLLAPHRSDRRPPGGEW